MTDIAVTTMEKPKIYITYDSSLSPDDMAVIREATEELNALFPMCTVEHLDSVSGDAFLEGTFNEQGRANSNVILQRMHSAFEKLPDMAAAVLITDRDLYSSSLKLKWLFGAANIKRRVTAQSLCRYKDLDEANKSACIRRTLRHELGHCFGMASDLKRVNTEDNSGPHCTVPGCSMRQAENLQVLQMRANGEDRRGMYFCPDCMEDLKRHFEH